MSPGLRRARRMLPEDGSYASCSGCGRYGGWANSGEIDIMEIANTVQEVGGAREDLGGMPEGGWWLQGAR